MYFLLPSLAPIPFFPTNAKDMDMIIKSLLDNQYEVSHMKYEASKSKKIRNTKYLIPNTIIDLGAGTGTVIFAAAHAAYNHHLPTNFIAVEIHPLLVSMMYIRRFFHPNKKNIHIMRSDIFKINYKQMFQASSFKSQITIYIYVGLFVMDRLKKSFVNLPKGTRIVSYMYAIPKWEKKLIAETKGIQHDLYEYVT